MVHLEETDYDEEVNSAELQRVLGYNLHTETVDIEDTVVGEKRVTCEPSVSKARNKHQIDFVGNSFVQGTNKVFIKTWGCSHNSSDSEYMAGLLAAAGYEIVDLADSADLWLLNSCTVKTPSEDQLRNYVKNAVSPDKDTRPRPVVLAGCVPQAAPKTPWIDGFSVVGVQQIDRIVQVVDETLKGNTVRLMAPKRAEGRRLGGAKLTLPKIRKNPLIEILAINTGCLNHCTYCKTKQARGDLASYKIEELVERAKACFDEGVRELWLTSEDLGAYGRDIGVTLPDLLDELVKVIPDGCMMRLGMTNPPYILDHLPEIAKILRHPRVYAFLHVPVQSGSDAVLADMKREYTSAHFRQVVDHMLETVEDVHIATDFICAFPTETDEDFEESMQLIRQYQFRSVFINQYYPRPGTPAAKLQKIDAKIAKQRTREMSEYFRSYQPYSNLVGTEHDVLITEWASDNTHLVGHNKSYTQVLILPPEDHNRDWLMGRRVRVRITQSTSKFSIHGQVLDGPDSIGQVNQATARLKQTHPTNIKSTTNQTLIGKLSACYEHNQLFLLRLTRLVIFPVMMAGFVWFLLDLFN